MTVADLTAWAHAHAAWLAGAAGWFVPSPRSLLRRLVLRIALKGTLMQTPDLTKIAPLALAATKTAIAAYKLEQAYVAATDDAGRRAVIVGGAAELIGDIAAGLGADGAEFAAYATPELVGAVYDIEQLLQHAIEARLAAKAAQAAA
jgi:hypothetical protein